MIVCISTDSSSIAVQFAEATDVSNVCIIRNPIYLQVAQELFMKPNFICGTELGKDLECRSSATHGT